MTSVLSPFGQRHALWVLAVVTGLALGSRLLAWNGNHRVESDTNPFLMIVARLHGDTTPQEPNMVGTVVYRFTHPVYAILIWALEPLTPNWIVAARLAALLPGLLVPAVICLIAWQLNDHWTSGAAAGLLAAGSSALALRSTSPMPDTAFTLCSAVTLWLTLVAVRHPTAQRVAAVALAAGLAWATRPNGIIYAVTAGVPIGLGVWLSRRHSSGCEQPPVTWMRAGAWGALFLLVFSVAGRGPSVLLADFRPASAGPPASVTSAIRDAALFTQGATHRDQEVYRLNADCTALNTFIGQEPSSTAELWRAHRAMIVRTATLNIQRVFTTIIPRLLKPFPLVIVPLVVGLVWVIRHRSGLELLALGLFVVPYLVVIPALQLHEHYLLPVTVAALALAGIGLAELGRGLGLASGGARKAVRLTAAILLVALLAAAIHTGFITYRRADKTVTYQQAAAWLQTNHGQTFDFAIMSRYHGMYAYLKCTKTSLPVDNLERVARYCRHTNTRYIVVGPDELKHNTYVREAFAARDEVSVATATFKVVARFTAPWNEPCRIIEVLPRPEAL